jgi:hypothetical protein
MVPPASDFLKHVFTGRLRSLPVWRSTSAFFGTDGELCCHALMEAGATAKQLVLPVVQRHFGHA